MCVNFLLPKQKLVLLYHSRCNREAEAGVHIEQRRGSAVDDLLAARGSQEQHAGVSHGRSRRGLREPTLRLSGDRLRGENTL